MLVVFLYVMSSLLRSVVLDVGALSTGLQHLGGNRSVDDPAAEEQRSLCAVGHEKTSES